MAPAVYVLLEPNPFMVPTDPGAALVYTLFATPAVMKMIDANFEREKNYFILYKNIYRACFRMLDELVPNPFKVSNNPALLGWNTTMSIEFILGQMESSYGKPSAAMLFSNNTLFKSVIAASDTPEALFYRMEQCQEIMMLGNLAYTPKQVIANAVPVLMASKMFPTREFETWDAIANKTYPALKTFFHDAYNRKLNAMDLQNTSSSLGYAPTQNMYNVLDFGNDDKDPVSFLHMTGLTRPTFEMLLDYLFDLEYIACHCQCRRPCSLGPEGYLGLLLFYLGSTMQYKYLCLMFGVTLSVCSRVINTMPKKVVQRLRSHPFAQVKFPNAAKMKEFANMVQEQEPLVSNIIGFMDGISFPAEFTDKHVKQNAYYCRYDCDTMVNDVFAYGPNGNVFFVAINFLESWADGSLTAHFLGHLKAKIGDYKICVDRGFPRSGDAYGTLAGLVTKRAARRLHRGVCDYLLWISNVHMLLWQVSEKGMRGLQGTFPCCKKRLPSDSVQ
jgi:hypothetical protein